MAKYELLERSFIQERLWEPGEIVDVPDGTRPGPHMRPVDSAAKKMAKEVGLVNGPAPDYINEMTPSPGEPIRSGMALGLEPEQATAPSGMRLGA